MLNISEEKVKIRGHDIFYRSAGTGEETILLMHGIPTNSFLWIYVIPQLAQKYRVIAPDMLGFGNSDRAAHEHLTLPKQAEYAIALMDSHGIKKFHVAGHDLGGGVTQILAANYTERVSSFLVIDGVTLSNWPLPQVVALRYPTSSMNEPSINFIERMLREGLFHQTLVTPELLTAFLSPFNMVGGDKALQEASFALDHHQTEDLVPRLKELEIPATFLYGQYDNFLPPFWGQELQKIVPNSTFKVLPECSHYSMIDNPLLVTEEILEHLKNVK